MIQVSLCSGTIPGFSKSIVIELLWLEDNKLIGKITDYQRRSEITFLVIFQVQQRGKATKPTNPQNVLFVSMGM